MRIALLALLAALGTLTYTVTRPHLTVDTVDAEINSMLDIDEGDDGPGPGAPTYVARVRICTWDGETPTRLNCIRQAETAQHEYTDEDTCEGTEWAAIQALAVVVHRRRGQHIWAHVDCVQQYEA